MAPESFLVGLALFNLVYLLVVLALTDHFFTKTPEVRDPAFSPPVSIIVPIRGKDDGMYENFLALSRQDYPCVQVIFVVGEPNDPALSVIHQVIQDCPDHDISLLISDRKIGVNDKVNNLENGYQQAKYDYLVFIDSDIRVGLDYLKQTIPPLSDDRMGLVTCMPAYRDSENLPAALELIGVNSNVFAMFIPLFLLGGMRYGSGATLAMRRHVLEEIGGFKAVADLVADDAAIGQRVSERGYRVYLSPYIVHTIHQQDSWRGYFFHTLRWNRTIRAVTPGAYISFALFFGTFYAFLVWILDLRNVWAMAFFVSMSFIRIVMTSYYNDRYIKDPSTLQYLWVVPVRDLITPFEWLLGFTGQTIRWRGHRYRIVKGARLQKIN